MNKPFVTFDRRSFLVASALVGASEFAPSFAADPAKPLKREIRDFEVWVKQTKSGTTRLKIEEFPEKRLTVATSADVTVSFFGIKYLYRVESAEQWQGETLERLESETLDGGAKISVAVEKAGDAWSVTTDRGKPRREATVDWTTSFLTPPAALAEGGSFAALDVDTGKLHKLKIERAPREKIAVGDGEEECEHYRVTGSLEVELWYDSTGRLAKRKSVESGYVTELRLVDLRREKLR